MVLGKQKNQKGSKNKFLIDLIHIALVIVKLLSITAISELEAQTLKLKRLPRKVVSYEDKEGEIRMSQIF